MYYTQQPVQFMYNPQAAVYPAVSSGAHDYQQVNLQSNYYAPNAETSSCNCGYDQTYGYATCAGCNYECADCNKGCSGNSCYSGCGDCNSGHGCCQSTEWNSNKNNNNNNMHSNSCHAHGHHHNHNHHHSHQNQKSVTVPASSNIPYSGTNALSITPQSKELGSPRVSQAPDQSPNIRPLQSTPLPSTIHLLGTLGGPSRASQAGFGSIDARVNQFSSASQPNSTPQMQPLNMHNLGQTGNQPQFQHELRLASTPQSAPMGNDNLMFASNNRPGFSNSVNEMSPKPVHDMSPRSYFLSPTNHSTGYGLHTPSGGSGSPVHSLGMNRDDITVKTRGGSFLQNIDSHGIISAESEIFQPDRGDSFQNSPSKMHLARQSFGSASRISPRSARHANRVVAQVPLSEDIMNKFSAFDVVERCRVGQALRNDIVNHFRDVCVVHPEDVLIEFDRMKQKVIHAAFEMPTGLSEAVWDTLEGRSRIPVNPESMIRELIKVDQSV